MRKLLFLFLISSIFSYSENYDLVIKNYEKEKLENKLYNFNKLKINSDISYNGSNFILGNSLKWGVFNHNISFDVNKKEILSHTVGISSILNDFFYNKLKEADIDFKIKKSKIDLEKENRFLENINLYKNYILQKNIVDLNNEEKSKLELDLKILEKNFENGIIAKIDYESIKKRILSTFKKFEFDYIKLERVKEILLINELSLENIPNLEEEMLLTDDNLKKYIDNNILNKNNLEIEKLKIEKRKDVVFNKLPIINSSLVYDINNKKVIASLNISKDIDFLDYVYKNDMLKLEIEEKEKKSKKEYNISYISLKNDYERLKFNYEYLLNEYNILNDSKNIFLKKYELGNISLKEMIEKRNEILKIKKELKESLIELNIFIIKIRRGMGNENQI